MADGHITRFLLKIWTFARKMEAGLVYNNFVKGIHVGSRGLEYF